MEVFEFLKYLERQDYTIKIEEKFGSSGFIFHVSRGEFQKTIIDWEDLEWLEDYTTIGE